MSVITGALLAIAALLSLVAYRTRGDRFWVVLGALFAIALVLSLIRNGLSASLAIDIGDALVFLVGAVAAAEAFGLPRGLAVPLGLGLRSREWEFDRKLADLARPLGPLLDGRPPDPRDGEFDGWNSAAIEAGRARLGAIARLKPPDDKWRALMLTYVRIYTAHLDAIQGDSPAPVPPSIVEMTKAADVELERLRAFYRAEGDHLAKSSIAARVLGKRRD